MDGLGAELPPRRTFVWVLVLAAVVFAVPVVRTVRAATGESGGTAIGAWASAAVMALVLVVAPLLLVRSILTRHTHVSDDAVSVVTGGEVRQQIAFDDLTEIRVRYTGDGGKVMPSERILLSGEPRVGRGTIVVSRFHVESLQPLLRRLAAEVAERPALLQGDLERDYFQHAVTTAL
ncbi:hypothetical protein [Nocardioides sp. zg-1228]|uniref:hypothetical protein n=1 Tax=Nocardioides sp. zg-1228 TaxID=2763008 RepID=UPI0016430E14|nr:hypothetical protein [Nocardioides sp. zg-1228]MBC2932210.1 hypothetical protein [Nocardioides sp. zg-1228]QSF57742.1 hypothetical protein JX575_00390 [Nocardioides sp. zg-1228]